MEPLKMKTHMKKTDEPYSDYEEWYEGWFYSKMEDKLQGAR